MRDYTDRRVTPAKRVIHQPGVPHLHVNITSIVLMTLNILSSCFGLFLLVYSVIECQKYFNCK